MERLLLLILLSIFLFMEQLSNNKQNGMVIIAMLFIAMLAQLVLLADKILGHSPLSWWWVWSPSLALLAFIGFLVMLMCIRILVVEIVLYFTERYNKKNDETTD